MFNSLSYQHDNFGDDGLAYRRHERFANANPHRRNGFPNPNREAKVSYPNHDREGGYPNPQEYTMKVDIPSFSEILISNPFWIGSTRWINSFIWLMFSWRNKLYLWCTNLREEQPHCRINCKYHEGVKESNSWWHGGAWSNFYKVDSFYPIINRSCTINSSNVGRYENCDNIHRWVLSPHVAVRFVTTEEQQTAKYIHGLKYPI